MIAAGVVLIVLAAIWFVVVGIATTGRHGFFDIAAAMAFFAFGLMPAVTGAAVGLVLLLIGLVGRFS